MRENRETPWPPDPPEGGGPVGEGDEPNVPRARHGESYSGIVPLCGSTNEAPNKGGRPLAEGVEERPLTKENMDEPDSYRAQNRESELHRPDHVREATPNRVCYQAAIRGRNRVRQ